MAWPKLLVLVRHAESLGNTMTVNERAAFECSSHQYPLTERGREQARITGEWLRATYGDFDVRYVSYYRRARETMEIIAPNAKIYEDPRLAEAQRGIFHTLTKDEIERQFPGELRRKEREDLYHFRPLGGENWPDIELRIHSFLGTLARDRAGERVLIVVHGHWLMLFQRLIHHFSIEETIARYKKGVRGGGVFENASVTAYAGKGPWYAPWARDRLVLVSENVVPWKGKVEENTEVT